MSCQLQLNSKHANPFANKKAAERLPGDGGEDTKLKITHSGRDMRPEGPTPSMQYRVS